MQLINFAFLAAYIIGVIFIVEPIVGRLMVGFLVMKRSRFYQKRKSNGRYHTKEGHALRNHPVMMKLNDYLSVAEVSIPATYILALCLLITIFVFIISFKMMPAPGYDIIIALLFGTVPLLWCWSRFQKKTIAMASVMIPTVQNFIGYFTEAENLESAIYKAARTIPFEISSEWNRLIMDLQTGERPEKALIQFADRVGNDWAHYFADIIITHVDTGVNITPSLFKLIGEMQNSEYNEEKRLTLLTAYKYGTFIMIGLAAFVVYFNIRMDPENYDFYFHTSTGVNIITLSVFVLFISFIGAMYMGRKKL
ncbi:hypothetical protein SAMN02799624_05892 [Paenibacillus sp. UNC496MF]|uniref:type II secretion system F family protein n=1 Tax=Paenibacillus sp. UNC496MF TaxID=1502753 RepID=UPI0008E608F7|nr:hypothetical protein [Paenibacillus sp. UNC496MF]SFJ77026.1 hypothetical protein SAMN02799624_05892 [Paenibacillus sp. UNC496MF]